jgi:hypothetical protein
VRACGLNSYGSDWVRWRALVNTAGNLRVSIKDGEFLKQLRDYKFLKKDSVSWN